MSDPAVSERSGGARGSASLQLLREMLRLLLRHPWVLAAAILSNVLIAAVAPVQGWLARNVLNQVSKGDAVFDLRDLLPYAWMAAGTFLGLALLYFAEKITNRMFDDRMLIEMQRAWFDRCGSGCAGERVARSINDCECARKVFDLVQRDLWLAVVGLPAVFVWQLSLGPQWLPALLLAAAPPFALTLLFGGLIQRTSLRILQFVSAVGSAVASGDRQGLYAQQENFFWQRLRFEFWKQCSETTAEYSRWLGVALVLAASATGAWQVAPSRVTAGEIGLFLVNLGLLTRPLAEITKVHNKIREGWPAVRRVLRPDGDAGVMRSDNGSPIGGAAIKREETS